MPDITADDVALPDSAQQQALSPYLARAYTWQSFFYESTAVDNDWDALYHTIYVANTVAEQVLASTGGTEAQKQELLAEAQVHRAHAYLTLVNMYARQYDPATAATDPGVPLVLTSDVGVSLPRVSVQAVYTQVIQDLTTALPYLPTTYTYNTQPTKAAAYALLARTYLQQRVYPSAQQSAETEIRSKNRPAALVAPPTAPLVPASTVAPGSGCPCSSCTIPLMVRVSACCRPSGVLPPAGAVVCAWSLATIV